MERFSIFSEAAERAAESPYIINLLIERLGVRVSGRRLAEDRFGKAVNALRYERMISWEEVAIPRHGGGIIREIEAVERGLRSDSQ